MHNSKKIMNQVEIFTDGACRGNPGRGGWGALIRKGNEEEGIYGGKEETTNNQMELVAAIRALEHLQAPSLVILTTDSEYLRKGITEWITKWKERGWKTASKKPVLNKELWVRLDHLSLEHNVSWKWVKGHSGHRENEIADELANKGIDEL